MELLRKLTQTPGIPGREEPVAEVIKEEMAKICDEVNTDNLGNVIGVKKGTGNKKMMLAGHMDEIGFLVKHIDKKGFIRLQPVGGFDARTLIGQRVIVHGEEDLIGNLSPATKPVHILSAEEKKKQLQVKDFFVDLGMSGEKVKEMVKVGDPITLKQDFEEIGDTYSSKAMDDRVGVYVMLEAVKNLQDHEADIYLVATSQEEVGLRGATTSAFGIDPDLAIALDVTIAADTPGGEETEKVTSLGEGTAIKIMDSSIISNRKIVDTLKQLAEDNDIDYQMEILPRGGNDAGAVHKTRAGIPSGTISIPCRYVHSVNEMIHKDDLEASVNLLKLFLAKGDLSNFD